LRQDGFLRQSPRRPPGGGTRSKPARKAPAVPRDLPTNGARQTALVLLGQLEQLQAKLAEKIRHVKDLAEVL